ncbi:Zinc finger HIT-type [Penicillium lagena]|uniref:Zinc finger HIT-type n=1 Tax=Penicillium lagena TaxID=94218 RepID=UPI0025417742|nr:Zinc finger HIT-type [Penicillium lagena]KAJ5612985.1 Zinc finger HIT-type [Penicillium lagena]
MFRVELLTDTKSTAQPGWAYVPDRGFDPAKAAMAPALGRKRGIRDAGKGGDMTSRQNTAIVRHLAELDRENQRDVQIPVPVKQAKEAGARGTRAKTTSNVRRILQSQKTFRNHLDDEEAAISLGAAGVSGGGGGGGGGGGAAQGPGMGGMSGGAVQAKSGTATKTSKSSGAAQRKRPLAAGATTSASATPAPSLPETAEASTGADEKADDDESARKPKLLKTEYDNDPLLRSYAPTAPSVRIMQRLLAEPPLSYNASRAGQPSSTAPPRHFCCMCGYWGKIRCKSCYLRTCGLECYKLHEDSRCGAFF